MTTYCGDSLQFPQNAGNVGCKLENHVEREKKSETAWFRVERPFFDVERLFFDVVPAWFPTPRNQSPVWGNLES